MESKEINIGGTYVIGTSKETNITAHNFMVGQKVVVKEKFLSGFIAKIEKTGVEQFLEASDFKREIKKTDFSTTLSRAEMASVVNLHRSKKCNILTPEFRDKAGISKSQQLEVLSNFLEIKNHYNL
jgi:hypothetical protein